MEDLEDEDNVPTVGPFVDPIELAIAVPDVVVKGEVDE